MFWFDERIIPDCPLNSGDPPPIGWREIDTSDYRAALFGFPNDLFVKCCEWEKREIKRIEAEEREKAEKELQEMVDNFTPEQYLQMARGNLNELREALCGDEHATSLIEVWAIEKIIFTLENIISAIEKGHG